MKKPPRRSSAASIAVPQVPAQAPLQTITLATDALHDFDYVSSNERITLGWNELIDAWNQFKLRRSLK